MQMRVIYMGTPDFAVHALVSIVEAGHDVVACFTQPDKAKGKEQKASTDTGEGTGNGI